MDYNIITIEREYASGGSEIGRALSSKLGIPCYGREILEIIAEKIGKTPEQIEYLEESSRASFLYLLATIPDLYMGQSNGLTKENELYLAESQVIKNLSNQGSCIIVGRCANWVLRDRSDVLNVFVHADLASRKKRAIEEYGRESSKIESILKEEDRRRSNFYKSNSDKLWDNKTGYHMMLDSGKLGMNQCSDIIMSAFQSK